MSIFGFTDTHFGLLVTSPLGFKAWVGNLICTLVKVYMISFPEIEYGSPHACFSRGRLLDSNGRPPVCSQTY